MPLSQISANIRRPVVSHPKRRGKTIQHPLSIAAEVYKPPPARKRKTNRHYNRQTIFKVLQYINFHIITYLARADGSTRVPRAISGTATRPGIVPTLLNPNRVFWDVVDDTGPFVRRQRSPTYEEVSVHFLIPERTIRNWWYNRENIINAAIRPPRKHVTVPCAWPDLENALFDDFWQRRVDARPVTRSHFRRTANKLFKVLYPHCDGFKFSNGWFAGFLGRHGIVRRRLTNQASKLPSECIAYCNSFLK